MRKTRQRGAALLTAMIIVTLVAALAAAMVWRQYRAVQVEAAERARAQSGWVLLGALDYGRLVLRSDKRDVDHLSDAWAVPLEETRLSTFLAADRTAATDAADAGLDAFLYGGITDAQALYNLGNLVVATEEDLPEEQRTLQALCDTAGVAPGTAELLISRLRLTRSGTDPATALLPPRSFEQLAWLGVDADTLQRLRPYATLLPGTTATAVNLNTAPREVIAALLGIDLATAERLVQARKADPLNNLDQARRLLAWPPERSLNPKRMSVASSYFVVYGRLRYEGRMLEERTLVQRNDSPLYVRPRQRDRLTEQTPPRMPQP